MSCNNKVRNICTMYKMKCNIEPETMCAQYVEKDTVEEPVKYCKYCFNARIYKPTEEEMMDPFTTELTDENDSSSCGVGHACSDHRWMISSGYGEPVRIEMDCWNKTRKEWVTVGKYYPKYCPECGRRLDEYEH